MEWNQSSIPQLQRYSRWISGMDQWFQPTHYWACGYLSMVGLKLIHVSKMGTWHIIIDPVKQSIHAYHIQQIFHQHTTTIMKSSSRPLSLLRFYKLINVLSCHHIPGRMLTGLVDFWACHPRGFGTCQVCRCLLEAKRGSAVTGGSLKLLW